MYLKGGGVGGDKIQDIMKTWIDDIKDKLSPHSFQLKVMGDYCLAQEFYVQKDVLIRTRNFIEPRVAVTSYTKIIATMELMLCGQMQYISKYPKSWRITSSVVDKVEKWNGDSLVTQSIEQSIGEVSIVIQYVCLQCERGGTRLTNGHQELVNAE